MSIKKSGTTAFVMALALASWGCGSADEGTATSPTGRETRRAPTAVAPAPVDTTTPDGQVTSLALAPTLGTAGSFAVLGHTTVTNTGATVLNGDVGTSNPGSSIVGFPPGIVNGATHAGDATAGGAQDDVTIAFNALSAQPCDANLSGQDLGGLTLTPGVYCFFSDAFLTGTLTLDGQGNPDSVWVFKVGSSLTTASGARVAYINAGRACGTFWRIGSSATLGTNTDFSGHVLALASITLVTGTTSQGGLFARTGAVTLDTNVVTSQIVCGLPAAGVPALPPAAVALLLAALLGAGRFLLGRG